MLLIRRRVGMSGPWDGFDDGLVGELEVLGYATTTASELMRLAAHLSRWMEGAGLRMAELIPSVTDVSRAERRPRM